MGDRWAIVDRKGIVEEGPEDFVKDKWTQYKVSFPPDLEIEGDLMLVEIHDRLK